MSIVYCEECDKYVDTDFEVEHEENHTERAIAQMEAERDLNEN